MSHMLSLQNMYPFRDIFMIIKKRLSFYSKLILAIPTFALIESEMSLHAGQEKNVIARTNNYSKSVSGRAHAIY